MGSALNAIGFFPPHNFSSGDLIKALRWQAYGEDLRYSLKNKYDAEEHKSDLERLYSVLDEVGNHLATEEVPFDIEWFIKCTHESREFPSLGNIDDKILSLRDCSLTDAEQYKNLANFIRNCQRTIKRILNDEPIYLIKEERKDFLELSYLLSSPPEKKY